MLIILTKKSATPNTHPWVLVHGGGVCAEAGVQGEGPVTEATLVRPLHRRRLFWGDGGGMHVGLDKQT